MRHSCCGGGGSDGGWVGLREKARGLQLWLWQRLSLCLRLDLGLCPGLVHEAAAKAPCALSAREVLAVRNKVKVSAWPPLAAALACEVPTKGNWASYGFFGRFGAFECPKVRVLLEQRSERGSGSISVLLEQRRKGGP